MHDSLEEKMQSANKSLVEGRDDFQEQGHPMAGEVQRNGGPKCTAYSVVGAKYWSKRQTILDGIQRKETKVLRRLFWMKKN